MELLKVGDRILHAQEMIPALSQSGLLPRLIQDMIIDTAISGVELTAEEAAAAEAEFFQKNQIKSPEEAAAWAQQRYMSSAMVRAIALRDKRLAKFKRDSFENEVDSYFLQRKKALDRVLYSLIRTKQVGLAQELYFRIHDDGQPFADLARQYSEGQEAKTGGLIGPVELSVPHPALAGTLSISQPGQVWPPKRIGEWFIVVRLEKFFPAQLDEAMQQRLIDELFQQWLKQQFQSTEISFPDPNTVPVQAESVIPSTNQAPHLTSGVQAATLPISGTTAGLPTQASVEVAAQPDGSPEQPASATDPWS